MIRVLMVLGGPMGYGGTEAFLMNYYRHINHERVQFDFVCQGNTHGVYDDEIISLGGKVFYIPFKSKHPFKFNAKLKEVIKNGKYQIVHGQMDAMNAWVMWVAKRSGVPIRIAHSHNTNVPTDNIFKKAFNNLAKKMIPKYATDLWACSTEAGEWLFGKNLVKSGKVLIMHNAIDVELFQYDRTTREEIRNKYNIKNDSFVIGHVGRLSYQKNHKLLLKVFADYCKMDKNAVLFLIGDGELRNDLEEMAISLGIEEKVVFAGNQLHPNKFYNAMDIFVFPSFYEGLGITFLEAQTNGLFCICSENVPREGLISDAVFLSINDPVEKWSQAILLNRNHGRTDNLQSLFEKGYNIANEAETLVDKYESLVCNYKQGRT